MNRGHKREGGYLGLDATVVTGGAGRLGFILWQLASSTSQAIRA